jgi:hypothetical protein
LTFDRRPGVRGGSSAVLFQGDPQLLGDSGHTGKPWSHKDRGQQRRKCANGSPNRNILLRPGDGVSPPPSHLSLSK